MWYLRLKYYSKSLFYISLPRLPWGLGVSSSLSSLSLVLALALTHVCISSHIPHFCFSNSNLHRTSPWHIIFPSSAYYSRSSCQVLYEGLGCPLNHGDVDCPFSVKEFQVGRTGNFRPCHSQRLANKRMCHSLCTQVHN